MNKTQYERALVDARNKAMLMSVHARIPECGDFAEIAQNLDYAIPELQKEMVEMEELRRRCEELEGLLEVAACPSNCIGGAYPDNHGEPVQCQFCYEREELLK